MEKRYREFCWLYLLDFLRYLARIQACVVQAVAALEKQNQYVDTWVCETGNLPDIPHHKQ